MSNPEAGAAKENTGPEVGQMKKGDYMVHVYFQEGKQFKVEKDNLSSPMIQITCDSKTKYTTCKKDVTSQSNVYWGEHIFFEKNNMSKNEIEASQISIKVLNKGFLKDEVIGIYDFDVTYVYFQDKHTMFNSWIALSNPEGKDFNEITCYLKLGISITGPGDDQVAINDDTGIAADEQEILMPPSIRKQYKQLKIRFIKAEKFPNMDFGGTIDAMIQTTYMKKKLTTDAVTQSKATQETLIEQEFWLPVQWPLASDRLVLKVFDKDPLSNEIVGSMFFSLKQIITSSSGEQGVLKWYNLYGSPLGCKGENTDKMNEYPEVASTWKGRILIHTETTDTKNPEMKKAKLSNEFKSGIMKSGAYNYQEYEVIAEVGGGIALPGKKKYSIRIQINDFMLTSQKAIEQKGNYNRWSERLPTTTFKCPYKSLDELGRVYIYLLEGDEPICFWKGLAKDFMDPSPKFKWFPLTCDLSKGKVSNSWEAGLIQVKLSINDITKNGNVDFTKLEAWRKPPPKRLSSWKIRCFIFQCKDIPAADSDGASDPFIKLWNPDDKKIETQVIEDNVNPIFFEALELYYDFDQLPNAPPVVLNIWDKDDLLDGDDYLGRCVVYLTEASISQDDSIPEPKWHDIRIGFSDSDPPCGQMLISFSVVEDDYTYKTPITYLKLTEEIEYKDFNVEINVLGLRNLESFGLMPIKKPFVKFNLRSLLPPEKAQAVTNIKTQPSASGSNPNINTVITFGIDLPVNPLFCPKLQCDVFDYVYKGLVQPLIGTFTLSIGDILHEIQKERKDLLEDSERIISILKNRLHQVDNPVAAIENDMSFSGDQLTQAAAIVGTEVDDKSKLIEEEKVDNTSEVISPGKSSSTTPGKVQRKKQTFGANIFTSISKLSREVEEGLNHKLLQAKMFQKDQEKTKMLQERELDKERIKDSLEDFHKNLRYPEYVFDNRLKLKREALPKPPNTLFYEVGYDQLAPENELQRNKHYRRFYDDELENVKEIFTKQTFHTSNVIRGQSRGLSKSWFSWSFLAKKTDDSGQASNQKVVGQFKGRISVENTKDKEQFKVFKEQRVGVILRYLDDIHKKKYEGKKLEFAISDLESFEKAQKFEHTLLDLGVQEANILPFLKEQSFEDMIARMLVVKTRCLVRLYMLEGYEFAQKDIGSFSDPYLKIKCGAKKFNERDSYQLDQPNPKFHKCYEFDAEFPGAAPLVIKAYDYDDLFGDDLIGTTIIDLDDRFFCPEWQQIEDKPIEYRSLLHPSSDIPQGTVIMWLEIHPTNISTKGMSKVFDLHPQPQNDYEVRIVIYDTEGIDCEGDAEGTSDVFIKAHIDDKDKKETDTHFRCTNGKASFNYRLLYKVKAPRNNYMLTLQTWDRDLFKSNDFLGEIQLPLGPLFEDAILSQKGIDFNKKYYESYVKGQFEKMKVNERLGIKFYDEDSFFIETYDKEGKSAGKVRIGVTITSGDLSLANPVGQGRTEPNHSPFLPPPVGRIAFTMNPFAMLAQLLGPKIMGKIYFYLCMAICATLCVALLPMITSNIISAGILSII